MAPSHSRQLLAWTFPTIAILLSYLWFKRKRIGVRSDPGGTSADNKQLQSTSVEASSTPGRKFSRSLSGVETAPIDIIIPRELRAVKSNPVVISDEDLDLEIEKIKSMKNEKYIKSKALSVRDSTSNGEKSPLKERTKSPSPVKTLESTSKETKDEMAQDIACVEQKLSSLKLGMKENSKKKNKKGGNKNAKSKPSEHEESQRQNSERDSANHSPADVMLASPSLSSISDNHSEVSTSLFYFLQAKRSTIAHYL